MRDQTADTAIGADDRTDIPPARTSATDLAAGQDGKPTPGEEAAFSAGLAMLTAAFNNSRQGFLLLDGQLRVKGFNPRLSELIGFPPGVIFEGATAYNLISASAALGHYAGSTVDDAHAMWTKRLSDRTPGHYRSRASDRRTINIGFLPLGEAEWIITFEDISGRINAEESLAQQNERFDAALTNIPHGVCMFDSDQRLILCNEAYAELYAIPPELTVAGTPLQDLVDHRIASRNAAIELGGYYAMVSEAEAAFEVRSLKVALEDGRTMRIAYNPMRGGGFVATHEDITEAVLAEQQIRFLGSHDGLTGLPNRARLLSRVADALARAGRGEMFGLHHLDLDNFKYINEAHGRSIGDLLLLQAVERIRLCLREADVLARIGGDEFVALQSNLETPEQAGALARRLVDAIAAPFDLDGRQAFLGVSIGISVCPGDGTDGDVLLRNANIAMYRAKADGRNTYRFFEAAMDARLQERRRLELDLRRAMENGEFELYYQPQVDAQTEAITGCEALLRWRHPTRGMVPPLSFIALAEEIGLIVPLGAWVLQQACRDAATWPRPIGVAVNLSSQQFKAPSLVQTITAALEDNRLSPLRLELEVTESVLLVDSDSILSTLRDLRALGVRIAMDDFGTGYSSLSYLRSFPFDKIKIDRSFIKDFGSESDCSAIVRAVAGLGAELGMVTTAEGVETAEQLHQIRSLGCTEVQGYYFGRPCPASELLQLLATDSAAA